MKGLGRKGRRRSLRRFLSFDSAPLSRIPPVFRLIFALRAVCRFIPARPSDGMILRVNTIARSSMLSRSLRRSPCLSIAKAKPNSNGCSPSFPPVARS